MIDNHAHGFWRFIRFEGFGGAGRRIGRAAINGAPGSKSTRSRQPIVSTRPSTTSNRTLGWSCLTNLCVRESFTEKQTSPTISKSSPIPSQPKVPDLFSTSPAFSEIRATHASFAQPVAASSFVTSSSKLWEKAGCSIGFAGNNA